MEAETEIVEAVETSSAVVIDNVTNPVFYAGQLLQIYFMGICIGVVVAMLFWQQIMRIY